MVIFENFLMGFMIAIQPQNLLFCLIGVTAGTLVGVLPGLGPAAGLALLLPVTFKMDAISAIILVSGLTYGGMYGGTITSVLVNVPGEASTVVTCLDGHPMAKKGRAGPALGISALGSFIAGTLSLVGVMLLAPILSRVALAFSAPEYFSLLIMAMMVVTYLVKGSMIKALLMASLGLLLSTVGMDLLTGTDRYVYGVLPLKDGIGILPIAIGMYGITEVLETIGTSVKAIFTDTKIKGYLPSRKDWRDSALPMTRGTLLGFFMGILPGLSPMVPTFLSYGIEKKLSKHPDRFGTGVIEGVAAPEACNNAAATAGFVPLLGLGIPSNVVNAILLGALMIHGLQPGPRLITDHPDVFWGVVAAMYLGNIMCVFLNLNLIPLWVKVLRIPYTRLSVLILIFCLIGAYSLGTNIFTVFVTIAFGMFGYLFKKYGFERAPLVMAFILGPFIEKSFRQSLLHSAGSFMIFVTRPISAVFIFLSLLVLLSAFLTSRNFVSKLDSDDE